MIIISINIFEEWNTDMVIKGLQYCSEKELYSAGELKSSIIYMNEIQNEKPKIKKTENILPEKYRGNNPETRDLSIYENAMGMGCL